MADPTDTPRALRRAQAEAWLALGRVEQAMARRVAATFAAAGYDDITPAQAGVLMVLFQAGEPLTARQVAVALGRAEVTVGRFVGQLVANGWVDRSPDPTDARALRLRPTARAREQLPRFVALHNALVDAALRGLDQSTVEAFARALRHLEENLARPVEVPGAPAPDTGVR